MADKYRQYDGYDKYRNCDSDGHTINSGKAEYYEDGSLKRLSNISPDSSNPDYHHHEWLNVGRDGSCDYGCEPHPNHG